MKKILISLLTVTIVSTMLFSTSAFAYIYTEENLPYGVQTKPQQEMALTNEIKEEILQNLIETEYPNSNSDNIVVKYYGSLSNGAMLINHYNGSCNYAENI